MIEKIFKWRSIRTTKSHTNKPVGLSTKLKYFGFVDEGILVNTDGSLMASYKYRGIDNEASTEEEKIALSARVNQALCKLDFGAVVHIDSIRKASTKYIKKEDCHFPHPTLELIDDERRFLYERDQTHFENEFVLTITWLPPRDFVQSLVSIFFKGKTKSRILQMNEAIKLFKSQIINIEKILRRCFTMLEQMTSQEMLTFLHCCITGLHHPVQLPSRPAFLQSILASKDYITDSYPMIGDKHIRIISVYDFPEEGTEPAMLDVLNSLAFEYRWTTRFIFVKKSRALSYIKKIMETWSMKRKGPKEWMASTMDETASVKEDVFAISQEADAQGALAEVTSGRSKFGFYTNTVVIMDSSEEAADAKAEEVSSIFSMLGFTNQIEKVNAVDAFEGSWPGYSVENVRKPGLKTINLADIMPQTAIWAGSVKNECQYFKNNNPVLMITKSKGSTPFRFNFHVKDNPNTAILGPVRSGKSTFLNLTIAQWFRYKDAKVFVFDKGRSSLPLCYACDGLFYDLFSDDEETYFQPLAGLGKSKYELVWAQQWVESLCELQGVSLDVTKRNAITHGLEALASMSDDYNKTLTVLATQIPNREVQSVINRYTSETEIGAVFDGERDIIKLNNFTVFETDKLFANKNDSVNIPIITYLFHKLFSQFTGSPTLVVLDEFFLYLDHPVFRAFLKDFIKTVNKLNVGVVFATQQPADLFKSEIKEVLLENISTLVLLPNANAISEMSSRYYYEMGLNSKQIEIIAESIPQQDYFTKSANGVRKFELGLEETPGALSIIGKTSLNDIKKAKELKKQYGEMFTYYWYKEHGMDEYAEIWLEKYYKKHNISSGEQ